MTGQYKRMETDMLAEIGKLTTEVKDQDKNIEDLKNEYQSLGH